MKDALIDKKSLQLEYPWMTDSFIYKKTHRKEMPHIKKGRKLVFNLEKIRQWIMEGEVETVEDFKSKVVTSMVLRKRK